VLPSSASHHHSYRFIYWNYYSTDLLGCKTIIENMKMNWYLRGKIGIFAGVIWFTLYGWICTKYPPAWDSIPLFLVYSLVYWFVANLLFKEIRKTS